MPSLEDNQRIWRDYDWTSGGEEWSVNWGGAEMVWHGLVLPRLLPFLPARRALEIACGHGRFTRFLRGWVEGLQAVDLNPDCVVVCRERFRADSAVQVFEGDGLSLPMAEDGSVDLVFSYDSLRWRGSSSRTALPSSIIPTSQISGTRN